MLIISMGLTKIFRLKTNNLTVQANEANIIVK